MDNNELNKLLKSAAPPARPDAFWQSFPGKVTARLHFLPKPPDSARLSPPPRLKFFGSLTLGLAAACLAIGLMLDFGRRRDAGVDPAQLAAARKCFQEVEALFPHQVRAIIFDRQGPHLLLADKANVPASPPLYLKVCATNGCESVVTFSGQAIPFNGQSCEVLANAQGKVMLVGPHQVWSGTAASDHVSVAAEPLAPSSSL